MSVPKVNRDSVFPQRGGPSRLKGFDPSPQLAALTQKIIRDPNDISSGNRTFANGAISTPDPAYLRQVSSTVAQNTTDATSLQQLLPDIGLVKQLLISSVLAPKDLDTVELTFKSDRRQFNLPIMGQLLSCVEDYCTNIYDIKSMCPKILEDVLFDTGSYPFAVIPESSVDALINGTSNYSNESYAQSMSDIFTPGPKPQLKSMGLLRDPHAKRGATKNQAPTGLEAFASLEDYSTSTYTSTMPSLESIDSGLAKAFHDKARKIVGSSYKADDFNGLVSITDNFNVLKLAAVAEGRRQSFVKRKLAAVTPSIEMGYGNYSLGGVQRTRPIGGVQIVTAIKTKDMLAKPMVGHPLATHYPSESVISVFIQPERPLGFFILLDSEGHPLTLANRRDIYNDLSTQNNGTGSSTQGASQMIQMAHNLSIGVDPSGPEDPRQMARIYGQLLEKELTQRIAIFGDSAKLHMTESTYAIMMARRFKGQQTQIVYIPVELMTYVAFDYDERGFGRSLTEKGKLIGSMRAQLMFASLMGAIKNSVSRQRVNIELSENDIDPSKTIARTMDEFTRRRNVTMPFVASDPADMISYLNMAGVEFNVTGKGAPAHKIDVEDKQSNRAQVNKELDDMLRDRHYQNYLVTPETVVASAGADFAATVVTGNQLFAKRAIGVQDQLTPFLEQIVRKLITNDATILNELYDIVSSKLHELQEDQEEDNKEDNDVIDKSGGGKGTRVIADSAAPSPVDQTDPNAAALAAPAAPEVNPDKPLPTYKARLRSALPKGFKAEKLTQEERQQLIHTIIVDFIESITISLPRPNTASQQALTDDFDKHAEALDKALPYILDQSFSSESVLGPYAGRVDEVRAAVKAHLMRQWMRGNGFLPELEELTAVDEDGKPEFNLFDALQSHNNGIAGCIQTYLENLGPMREKIKEGAEILDARYPDAGLTQAGGGGGGDMGGGFGGGDAGGGMGGDMGADMGGGDLGGGDAGGAASGDMGFDDVGGIGDEPNAEQPAGDAGGMLNGQAAGSTTETAPEGDPGADDAGGPEAHVNGSEKVPSGDVALDEEEEDEDDDNSAS